MLRFERIKNGVVLMLGLNEIEYEMGRKWLARGHIKKTTAKF